MKKILTIVLCSVLLVGIFLFIQKEKIKETFTKNPSIEQVTAEAIKYINDNFLSYGATASLLEVVDGGNVYKMHLKITEGEEVLGEFDSYVTKDGKLLFPEGYDMGKTLGLGGEEIEIPKNDFPKVELFVMSFCPYGNQAEETMRPVYDLLKDKVDWDIFYVVYLTEQGFESMHGEIEIEQNKREACVLEKAGLDKWWPFVSYVNNNCGEDGSCWEDAAQEADVGLATINDCFVLEGDDLMENSATVSAIAGVNGSPTLMINGAESTAVYRYGQPQAYLEAICSAFNNPPEECSVELSSINNSLAGGSCQ